jgi:NAD(P)-dependent dehydrogenase (short-subunit alcohol dehydrogenase family)
MNDVKIALVTGASRGFGRSMAAHLAESGVRVIGTYHRSATEAEELAEGVAKNGGQLGFLIVAGRIADLLGRRRVLVAGATVFALASAISSLASVRGTPL